MGPAMENVMKTQSRWRSANREDEKAVAAAAAEIIMENIQSAPLTPPSPYVTTTSERVQTQDGCFSFTFTRGRRLAVPRGRGLNMGRSGRVGVIAADQAARRPLMTLSEQIRLWVINLDMESMPAVGFIRVSLTPEAWCSCCEATRVGKKKGKGRQRLFLYLEGLIF